MENTVSPHRVLTARAAGLIGCRTCGRVHERGTLQCVRCGARLEDGGRSGLQAVWAWWLAGLLAYIPANLFPMLLTTSFGQTTQSTIVGGAVELARSGDYFVALIVLIASVLIPVAKFIAIAYLALSLNWPERLNSHARHRLYEVVEFIGRWSMIDVFVVAILTALVQFGFAATINPGIASVSFALSVAFTMLSAQSFDPRLIWDASETNTP